MQAGESRLRRPCRHRAGPQAGAALLVLAWLSFPLATPGTAASARLSLDTTSITFPIADPDLFPVITSIPDSVGLQVRVRGAFFSQLTVLASGDLRSGSDEIPIDSIRWTATGPGFVSGALSKETPQLVGLWSGNVTANGTQRFQLTNSWSYATGNYSQTVVYTLVAL